MTASSSSSSSSPPAGRGGVAAVLALPGWVRSRIGPRERMRCAPHTPALLHCGASLPSPPSPYARARARARTPAHDDDDDASPLYDEASEARESVLVDAQRSTELLLVCGLGGVVTQRRNHTHWHEAQRLLRFIDPRACDHDWTPAGWQRAEHAYQQQHAHSHEHEERDEYVAVLERMRERGVADEAGWATHRRGRGVVTVMNHTSTLDLPMLLGSLLPARFLSSARHICWTTAAQDICFKNAPFAAFFATGKLLPVDRRGGVEQALLDDANALMDAGVQRAARSRGEWVHVFPEGRVARDTTELQRFRPGLARLLVDAVHGRAGVTPPAPLPACARADVDAALPVIVPIVHHGIHRVLPVKTYWPRAGQRIDVLVGEPIDVADLFVERAWSSRAELYAALTERIEQRMRALQRELLLAHVSRATC